ncbi:MAG: hypothetical protein PWQ55_576 [Chloroflexota bacterium]|nr:hypothetical protein [Chloroflexota bacterium]
MGIFDKIIDKNVKRLVNEQLAIIENENSFLVGTRTNSQSERDRFTYDRSEILEQSLEAWRTNPLARRIVELTSQYVVGGGLTINCKHEQAAAFLDEVWNHRLNRMPVRVFEMCDELTRTGNLFVLISTDPAGMSYLRVIPASNIEEIQSRENDIEQPVAFKLKASLDELNPQPIPAYDPQGDVLQQPVMLHYAINRPAGAQWGEPDLAPLLRWLSRYSNWLEDRARLNRYRNSFLFVVQAKFASEAQRKARQTALNANPPKPGSILVADENETWKALSPRLESGDAEKDGLAIKKMIAAGAGIPLHFLAEPESATRTTAEAAGGPTYRRFEQRQEYFLWMIRDILSVVLARRGTVDARVKGKIEFGVTGADISSNDNGALSQAAYYMISILDDLRDRKLITNDEFLRLIYRFFGETVDADDMLKRAAKENGEQGERSQPSAGAEGGDAPTDVASSHAPLGVQGLPDRQI